jgi:bacteriorhodopsin
MAYFSVGFRFDYFYCRSTLFLHEIIGQVSVNRLLFRYVDWVLTVPLMCLEFYLILKVAGAKQSLLWKMIIYSLVMLVTGYWGEVVDPGNAAAWGFASGVAYFLIVYEIWIGEAAKLAKAAGGNTLAAHKILCWFVLVGPTH